MGRKTFKEKITPAINPAMSFISQESVDRAEGEAISTAEAQAPVKAPAGYKVDPRFIETKSDRLQLLVQPSLKAKLKERAMRDGTSVNDLVHNILHSALMEE